MKPFRLPAGNLTQTLIFERQVRAAGFVSAAKDSWEQVCTVRAEVQAVLPSNGERLAEGLTVARRPSRIRIRWRADITADMRIRHGDRLMRIVGGPVEMGRRAALELMAEDAR